jgi:hypothetical protein
MRTGSGEERESSLQSGWTIQPDPKPVEPAPAAATPSTEPATEADGPADSSEPSAVAPDAQLSNLTVVLLGLAGGLYLLFALVWLSWAQGYSAVNAAVAAGSGSVGGVLQQIFFWIAPLAPILWFFSALVLARKRTRALVVALLLGLIVTFPLPMVFASGAAL